MRVGVDLVDITRFARIARHPSGRRLVFTPAELARADTLAEPRRSAHLAGRFCAKEATAKALGHGLGQGLSWRDIEVVQDRLGALSVVLSGGAADIAARAHVTGIQLSLSHEAGLAVCVAVALTAEPACTCRPAGSESGSVEKADPLD